MRVLGIQLATETADDFFVWATWTVNIGCVLGLLGTIIHYQYQKPDKTEVLEAKGFPKLIREEGNFKLAKKHKKTDAMDKNAKKMLSSTNKPQIIPEQVSMVCSFFVLKLIVSISSVHRPFQSFIYFLLLLQVLAYHLIVEADMAHLEKEQ